MDDLFGEVISTYTAEQAVEDGMLADVSKMGREAGFKIPVRITSTVYDLCTPPKSNKIQSFEGRLWDVLFLCFMAIKRHALNDSFVKFNVKLGRKVYELWAMMDFTSGPAVHIMRPEDY